MSEGVNYQGIIIGGPGVGKSTLQRSIANERVVKKRRGWGFFHDLTGDWARVWKLPVWESADAWRAEFARTKGAMPRLGSFACGSEELTALVTELGKRFNDAANVRFAMSLFYDEGALVDGSGSTHQGKSDMRVSAMRRHLGVELAFNIQRVTMLTEAFYTTSTDIYCCRLTSDSDVAKLEERCGLREGAARRLLTLPPHRYIHIRPGRGIVGDAL